MSPQQLLRETQRAAGDENLIKWHDTLISAGTELRTLQGVSHIFCFMYLSHLLTQTIETEDRTLNQMKERNSGIERDVQRYMERKKIEHNVGNQVSSILQTLKF